MINIEIDVACYKEIEPAVAIEITEGASSRPFTGALRRPLGAMSVSTVVIVMEEAIPSKFVT